MIRLFSTERKVWNRYSAGKPCYRCKKGTIVTTDVDQHCDYCGRILGQVQLIPFGKIRPGERFFSAYRPDELLIKMRDDDQREHRRNNYYRLGEPTAQGSCGEMAPCLREGDRRMVMSDFSHN